MSNIYHVEFMEHYNDGRKELVCCSPQDLFSVYMIFDKAKIIFAVYSGGCQVEPKDFGWGETMFFCKRGENIFSKWNEFEAKPTIENGMIKR